MFKQKHSANFETESIKSSLWDYFNAFILVTGDITVTPDNNTYDAFRNCILFSWCKTEINDLFKQDNFTKFETETIKSSFWDYFHRFTSTARDIMVTADNKTDVAVTNCAQFSTCETPNDDLFKQINSTKFETECFKSSLWDYFGALILVTGDITVTADNNTDVAFATFAPFSKCKTKLNDLFKQNKSNELETESVKSNLCVFFYTFFLVTGDIAVIP